MKPILSSKLASKQKMFAPVILFLFFLYPKIPLLHLPQLKKLETVDETSRSRELHPMFLKAQ